MNRCLCILSVLAAIAATLTGCRSMPSSTQNREPGQLLYVSTAGSDAWTGTRAKPNRAKTDGPFATLIRARDEIRRLKAATGLPEGGVTVEILGGRHEITEPLVLTAADSGTETSPIVYRGQRVGETQISGGTFVTGWQPVTDPTALERLPVEAREHVVQVDLKALGITEYGDYAVDVENAIQKRVARADGQGEYTMGSIAPRKGDTHPARLEVFCNGKPMQVARGPNDSHLTIEETLGEHQRVVRGSSSSVEGIFRYKGDYPKRWVGEKSAYVCGSWCRDWAEQRHRIETHDPDKRTIAVAKPYHYYGYKKGHWFYGFNILAELDRPGEWYIDRDAGVLYFWPPCPIGEARIEVSMAPSLVKMTDTSHITIRGLVLESARGSAINVDGAEQCRIIACTMRNLGMHGVTVTDGKENGVIGCDMHGMGAGGIYLVGGDRKTLTPAGHYAENNHIHHFGRWDRMYRPAIVFSGVGQRASHNLIHDAPHSAIIFGGNDHTIEFNEIHSVCYESNDCGAIYAGRDWTIRGHMIRYNYLHHLYGRGGRVCRTIYLDDSFAAATVFGNIFYQTMYSIFLGCGRDNTFENNVFIDSHSAMHIDSRALGWQKPHIDGRLREVKAKGTLRGIRFREPPYSTRYPRLLTLIEDEPMYPKGNVVRRNIFWPGPGENLRRMAGGNDPAETWWDHIDPKIRRFVKIEDNLINVDPRFVNEKAGNFQLRKDSPAWKLGFQRIPVKEIGLYRDADRASWPAVHTPRPLPPTVFKPPVTAPARKKTTRRTGPPPVLLVPRAAAPVTVDGVLDEVVAGNQQIPTMQIDRTLYHEPTTPKSHAWFRHDGQYLYVAVRNEIDGTKPLASGERWGRADAMELAVRVGKSGPILCLRGYPNGRFESSSEAKAPAALVQQAGKAVTFAARIPKASIWTGEYRVPLELLGARPGAKIECNISVRKSAGPQWVMWQGTGGLTWETYKAGSLELEK